MFWFAWSALAIDSKKSVSGIVRSLSRYFAISMPQMYIKSLGTDLIILLIEFVFTFLKPQTILC